MRTSWFRLSIFVFRFSRFRENLENQTRGAKIVSIDKIKLIQNENLIVLILLIAGIALAVMGVQTYQNLRRASIFSAWKYLPTMIGTESAMLYFALALASFTAGYFVWKTIVKKKISISVDFGETGGWLAPLADGFIFYREFVADLFSAY